MLAHFPSMYAAHRELYKKKRAAAWCTHRDTEKVESVGGTGTVNIMATIFGASVCKLCCVYRDRLMLGEHSARQLTGQ